VAAIKLVAYTSLDNRSIGVEKVLRDAGYSERNLYPRQYEKTYERRIEEGKALRIQLKTDRRGFFRKGRVEEKISVISVSISFHEMCLCP